MSTGRSARTRSRERARVVAAAVLDRARVLGVDPPPDLRLWALAGLPPVAPVPGRETAAIRPSPCQEPESGPESGPEGELAAALESATSAAHRRSNGLHVTPSWLADDLVERAFDGLDSPPGTLTVCDPSCGGGAFLLAAARALHARGVDRARVVRDLLWGADIDPVGLATAEAALVLWAGEPVPAGRLVVADALHAGARLWADGPPEGFGAVVGNPPFLNQLGRATVRSRDEARRLQARYGEAVRAYTDTAWLFLLLGVDLVRPGGRVVLVQPQSLVAARDAAAVRATVGTRADLRELWLDGRDHFAAAVHVCAPVLAAHGPAAPATIRGHRIPGADTNGTNFAGLEHVPGDAGAGTQNRQAGARPHEPPANGRRAPGRRDGSVGSVASSADDAPPSRAATDPWAEHLADALGIPPVEMDRSTPRLGDRAQVTAGFRDEYYGLVPLVREAPPGHDPTSHKNGLRPLVTVGVIDWAHCAWGERPTQFAKARWLAPVVDPGRADPADQSRPARGAARWLERAAQPKVLVANQTRVVEAVVDETGAWVPSVPTIVVLPDDSADIWRLAAAISSPTATAWLMRRAPGTAWARRALKIAARDLAELPLPGDERAWEAAAAALARYTLTPTPGALAEFEAAAVAAYQAPDVLVAWWRSRLGTQFRDRGTGG